MQTTPTSPDIHSIRDLLNGGDWACAECEPEGLANVCIELSRVLNAELADRAARIARMTDEDMPRATREWDAFATRLRHRHESLETEPRAPRSAPVIRHRLRPET